MFGALNSESSVPALIPGREHHVVSLGETLRSQSASPRLAVQMGGYWQM